MKEKLFNSMPFRLLLNNIRQNHILLLAWFILFSAVTGHLASFLGVPYLFLDPEYLQKVNFLSFLLMGVAISGFSVAFHIASYIVVSHKYSFLAHHKKPFLTFSINNSLIPFAFLVTYTWHIIVFQASNEFTTTTKIIIDIAGLLTGYVLMIIIIYTYFIFTNKDIFKILSARVDKKLKVTVPATRAKAMEKLRGSSTRVQYVKYFITPKLKLEKVKFVAFHKHELTKVFDQNHLNLVFIELFIFILLLIIGIFRDYEIFQIPAAASAVLLLTIIIMFAGAFSYWFGSWAPTIIISIILILNIFLKQGYFSITYKALGLDYQVQPAQYDLKAINKCNNDSILANDYSHTIRILTNWQAKFGNKKPKMLLVCASGGGQRSALWTFNVLQTIDSLTNGKFTKHTQLITGASGGIIGAAYFRELKLQQQKNQLNPYAKEFLSNISKDNLNPIIFSLLVNDLFIRYQTFEYQGKTYLKDRGYSFEEQLNKNTKGLLDKPLISYRKPEFESKIPMLIISPTIINDGRKLFISPQHISFMNSGLAKQKRKYDKLAEGIDFRHFFRHQNADSLRFLSALRMNASFPYITPNISLPSEPPLEIMDAGITDNFGIADALRFLYAYKKWIAENTSGVVIVSIRDSEKEIEIESRKNQSFIEKLITPIQSVYDNYANLQSVANDSNIEYARSWFKNELDVVTFQYIPTFDPKTQNSNDVKRASLNWRLTSKEKQNVIYSISSGSNQKAIREIQQLLK
ncbi:MAG: patatin-like phospholipase family protein [Cyclobacteriaceae bacterium]|nr:patatin-like phospholipase family protein [Cyclobacteriaceae bacterium]